VQVSNPRADEPSHFYGGNAVPVAIEEREPYDNPNHRQFVEDMQNAGLEPYHYRGRFFYEGPAVTVDDLQQGLGATLVKCQWDQMGRGWVVYPR
jgi:hypothetical protein